MHKYLITKEWLNQHLHHPEVRIIDCRFILGNPTAGQEAYAKDHVPGAVYFDLEKDMSGQKAIHGGRHPLPQVEDFTSKLQQAGIGNTTKVVAYDDQGGAMAARLWWLLQYVGHEQVFILNEGYSAWRDSELPVTAEIPKYTPTSFTANVQTEMAVDMDTVKLKKAQEDVTVIDSREEKRYLGMEEPIDKVAGHIPGAQNFFWKGVLDEKGNWKSTEELQKHFQGLDQTKEVIVYCGSGVTACPNILALKEAGFKNVKLYAGSWSDWCSYPENPVG
ncbi:sulfurtransferase [Ammoniphilus sp. YIM 78166]|uniref:sulfurtransferase n=1 Tax=Ammoniphilus sp. YIM 78166 TaxID=1644106 RepID=UPI0010703082|nr:sulfurtransferase [Ammoniphilus sp. YIM 78166]